MWNDNQFNLSNDDLTRQQFEKANIETGGGYQAKVSGDFGEFKLASILKSLPQEYHIINNVLLDTTQRVKGKDGKVYKHGEERSTQIDHVIVSPFGIFVVETKNHKGMIFGDCNGKVWTQVLNNRQHYTFYNPVRQNAGHIKHLSKAINVGAGFMQGIIVFTNSECNRINVNCNFCITPEQLCAYLMSFNRRILTDKQVFNVISRIDNVNNQGYIADMKHIEYVKGQKARYEYYRDKKKGIIR